MADPVNQDLDKVLSTAAAPIPLSDIPQELLLIYPRPHESDNVVNKAIYRQLIKQYIAEKNNWPPELQDEFKSEGKPLEYRISKSTGSVNMHKLCNWMFRQTTWARFWTLRVMFGPIACANQGWFEGFSKQYPMSLDGAPAGIVPENYRELFGLQQWTPEEPQIVRWAFHSTHTTSKGKRKAVRVTSVDKKKPKFAASSSVASPNTNTITAISTSAALEVKITMTARDERTNKGLQGSHGQESRPLAGNQQHSQQFGDSINLMEEAIKQCSALHQAQAESLNFLRNQMQLVKQEYSAKEKQLKQLLAQERSSRDTLEDRILRTEQAIKREDC